MTIKQHGGVFGRNPTFNDVEVTGDLTASGLDVSSGTLTLANDQISGDKIDGGTAGVDKLIADDVITAGGTTVTHGANSNGTIRVEGSSAPAFAINDTGQSKEYFLTALGDFVQMRYADAGDTGAFANSTSLLTMEATGDVTVNTGNLVIGTSGKGIDFSATGDGSGTTSSELFNDYEEGTFSVAASDGSNTDGGSDNGGAYTKVGNIVHASGFIRNIDTTGMTSGNNLRITGLPYTSLSTSYIQGFGGVKAVSVANANGAVFEVLANSTEALLRVGSTPVTIGDVGDDAGDIYFKVSYPV